MNVTCFFSFHNALFPNGFLCSSCLLVVSPETNKKKLTTRIRPRNGSDSVVNTRQWCFHTSLISSLKCVSLKVKEKKQCRLVYILYVYLWHSSTWFRCWNSHPVTPNIVIILVSNECSQRIHSFGPGVQVSNNAYKQGWSSPTRNKKGISFPRSTTHKCIFPVVLGIQPSGETVNRKKKTRECLEGLSSILNMYI